MACGTGNSIEISAMNPPGKRKTVADAYFELKVLADAWASAKQRTDDKDTSRKAMSFFGTLLERLTYPCTDAQKGGRS